MNFRPGRRFSTSSSAGLGGNGRHVDIVDEMQKGLGIDGVMGPSGLPALCHVSWK